MARLQLAACILVSGLVFCWGYDPKERVFSPSVGRDSDRNLHEGAKVDVKTLGRRRNARSLFWPGTNWCGSGDRAENYHDLGVHHEADACCRAHDHCPYYILARSSKYGVFNKCHSTISQCSCDIEFRDCLKAADTSTARYVGWLFFSGLPIRCFTFVDQAKTQAVIEYGPDW